MVGRLKLMIISLGLSGGASSLIHKLFKSLESQVRDHGGLDECEAFFLKNLVVLGSLFKLRGLYFLIFLVEYNILFSTNDARC